MQNNNNYVVIMAGGIGSRFWPYSRNSYPKQFLDVLGIGKSLLQLTYDRFLNVCPKENILVVTNQDYVELVSKQLPELSREQILSEPIRRNTAPCIAYATYKIYKKNKEACIVITPSDHAILKENLFEKLILNALKAVKEEDKLVTLGIKPSRPETGYGYIQYIESDSEVKKVKTFTEKPQLELAQKFIESGDFVWNAGIFIWNVKSIIHSFETFMPETAEIFEEGEEYYYTEEEESYINKAYSQCKSISIDNAVMEKADNVYVILGDFGWSDLGSWNSLHELKEKDTNSNVVNANALLYDTKNCMIKGSKDKLIVVQGLEGYLVAECDNVVLICKKDEEQKFRDFVSDVKAKKGEGFL